MVWNFAVKLTFVLAVAQLTRTTNGEPLGMTPIANSSQMLSSARGKLLLSDIFMHFTTGILSSFYHHSFVTITRDYLFSHSLLTFLAKILW